MKLEFFLQIFEKKYSDIKFHENPTSGSRFFPCGRTDRQPYRHEEAKRRFSQFHEKRLKTAKQICNDSHCLSALITIFFER